jgi:hypothetical protein
MWPRPWSSIHAEQPAYRGLIANGWLRPEPLTMLVARPAVCAGAREGHPKPDGGQKKAWAPLRQCRVLRQLLPMSWPLLRGLLGTQYPVEQSLACGGPHLISASVCSLCYFDVAVRVTGLRQAGVS